MSSDKHTPAENKLIKHIKKLEPDISDNNLSTLLNNFKRFVTVVQKIYTEPQAQITIKEKRIKGNIVKQRIISTDIEELKKSGKSDKPESIRSLFASLSKKVVKDKYDR